MIIDSFGRCQRRRPSGCLGALVNGSAPMGLWPRPAGSLLLSLATWAFHERWLTASSALRLASVRLDLAARQRLLQLLDLRSGDLRLSQVEVCQGLAVLKVGQARVAHLRAPQ